jgi:Domain of unknown function (DUF397)
MESPMSELVRAVWRTSSWSGANNNCVEVGYLPSDRVAVRDTKDRTRPAHLHTATAWSAFLTAVRAGEFGVR